ncbi:MAG TPA: nucleotide disphospho-sugar-binding domain-containing protein [Polyangiaceae bacterium]|nr:nucleotide disphospho-sugar-binding domain-containing protein [Polyangiaceae bacterium]
MTSSLKFILGSLGTLGDLLPFLALGKELMDRGHACHMLGSASGAGIAQKMGIEYSVVSPTRVSDRGGAEETFDTYLRPSYERTFRIFGQEHAAGHRLVVINQTNYSATSLMCDLYGLPLVRAILCPAWIDSLVAPAMPWRAKVKGPLGKSYAKYFLPTLYAGRERGSYHLRAVNEYRHAVGLDPLDSLQETERQIRLRLAFFPDWYGPPAADWPEVEHVGFPLPSSTAELPLAVSRLIARYGRPVVFTPGTGVSDVALFFAQAQRCRALLDRPAVFLSPRHAAQSIREDQILSLDYADLSVLLPHAALLVHHGGVGTTARALEAGIPQIICPHGYDQPDNAARIVDLGVGAVADVSDSSAEVWANAGRELLESESVAATLRVLSIRLARSFALARAADLLLQRFEAAN